MSRYAVATAREGVRSTLQWRREGLPPTGKRYCNGAPGRIAVIPGFTTQWSRRISTGLVLGPVKFGRTGCTLPRVAEMADSSS